MTPRGRCVKNLIARLINCPAYLIRQHRADPTETAVVAAYPWQKIFALRS